MAAIADATGFEEVLDNALGQFTRIVRVIEGATMLLALLIAFNAAGISPGERTREHATTFAIGLPHRVVTGMAVAENAVIGLLGTLAGLAGGYVALSYIVSGFDQVTPELLVVPTLSSATVLTTLTPGVLVVALAPLFAIRRERRINIPGSLRVGGVGPARATGANAVLVQQVAALASAIVPTH